MTRQRRKVKNNSISVNSVTEGALMIALVFVSFSLFTGVTNLINAVTVPILIYIYIRRHRTKEIAALCSGIFFICLIFFRFQVVFVMIYMIFALALNMISKKSRKKLISFTTFHAVVFTGLLFCVPVTDLLLGTSLYNALTGMSGGSSLSYIVLMFVQSIVISFMLLAGMIFLKKKILIV
jgi:hypothetical protein